MFCNVHAEMKTKYNIFLLFKAFNFASLINPEHLNISFYALSHAKITCKIMISKYIYGSLLSFECNDNALVSVKF